MLRPRATGAFKKDRKRAHRRGKDLEKLDTTMRRLANEEQLEPRFRDHKLSGDWKDFRECHIDPDWLLIYRVEGGRVIKCGRKMSPPIRAAALRLPDGSSVSGRSHWEAYEIGLTTRIRLSMTAAT